MSDEKERLISPTERMMHNMRLPSLARMMGAMTEAEWQQKESEQDAERWRDGPDAIPHAEAIAMLRVPGDLTAKEQSRIMERIRNFAGKSLRCHNRGNVYVYHRGDWANAAAGYRAALADSKEDDEDSTSPTPYEIEQAKQRIRRGE